MEKSKNNLNSETEGGVCGRNNTREHVTEAEVVLLDAESDCDSASSAPCAGRAAANTRTRGDVAEDSAGLRKRARANASSLGSEGETPASKIATGARGRGRATTASARGQGRRVARPSSESSAGSGKEESPKKGSARREAAFIRQVKAAIEGVCAKRLPSTKREATCDAASAILVAAKAAFESTSSEELLIERRERSGLVAEVALLRKKNEELEARLKMMPCDAVPTKVASGMVEEGVVQRLVEGMASLQAQVSALQGIVLRPPLAAGRGAPTPTASYASVAAARGSTKSRRSTVASAPAVKTGAVKKQARVLPPREKAVTNPALDGAPNPAQKRAPVPSTLGKKAAAALRAGVVQQPKVVGRAPTPGPDSLAEAPAHSESVGEWVVVGERQKARKAGKRAAQRQQRAAKRVSNRLRAPKTAAVVFTLQPEAIKRGVTYSAILAKAKATAAAEGLTITVAPHLRIAATGARVLEFPGADAAEVADALAEKLRAYLPAEEVRISRPMKCADLRLIGLEDSVTVEEVVAAVAKAGGCPPEQVKSGAVRPDFTGLGTAIVSCPVAAAGRLAAGRRLLVGWAAARVKLLEPKPLRCYRCHVGKHVACKCTAEEDRSDCCFRCGRPGHKANVCEAAPYCSACAAAGKSAVHRAGGKSCAAPIRRVAGKGGKASVAADPSGAATTVVDTACVAAAANVAEGSPKTGVGKEAVMDYQ